MQEHNLFKVKNLQEAQEATIGSCNGFSASQRFEAETYIFAEKILRFARREAEILDYGTGYGRLAKEILKQNPTVFITGVDDSPFMLNEAAQYVCHNNFQVSQPDDKVMDKKYDIAYCIYVLQHVPAIEIREILSRIYSHLKDDGRLVYCSSDFRMSIRFDGKGFFDDRFLGVNLQEEVERYFDKVEPLFTEEDFKDNYVLKKMITGCDNGLAHPAFVYKKKKEVNLIKELAAPMGKAAAETVKNLTSQKLLLINRLSPGDILVMTNAIRDLHLAWPGKFITDVRTPCPDIFVNNPYITKLTYDEVEYNKINTWFQSHVGQTKMLGDINVIDMQYPLIHKSGARGAHFAEGHREFLEETLKVKISQTKIRPELYLSEQEKNLPRLIKDKYWVINAGSKSDYTLKQYPYYQEVINLLKDKITFVQIGVSSHNHKPLEGVIDMVGKTNTRELFKLIYHAEGVISCVALPMHVAAAFKKPCVVVAGAREGTRWELYPNHRFIYVNGCLPCADYDGCWRSKSEECNYKKNGVPKCMSLIKPEEVAKEVKRYYEGGVLKYDIKEPVILNLKGEEKMNKPKEFKTTAQLKKEIGEGFEELFADKEENKQIIYESFPLGINSPQATSSIFNILRILKQLTPADAYLEAYQWHYNKRKENFMDVYHFMQYLGATIRPKRILEIGTRTGISICQLLSAYLNYNDLEKVILCDLFNDGLSTPGLVLNALKYLNIPIDKVQFIIGNSLEEIPKLIGKESYDWILVDGCHEREYTKQDLENSAKLIEQGGYLCVDDLTEDGCNLQPVWDEFKQKYYRDFVFMEDSENGKGAGIGKRI